jgi:hypothetical protein
MRAIFTGIISFIVAYTIPLSEKFIESTIRNVTLQMKMEFPKFT